ncbi:MAG: L,D-transpeptidase [Anaerolineales bacterium]|nr:L,D-transpeptidase [Anaerolineales bacterium]
MVLDRRASLTRREFLSLAAASLGSLALSPLGFEIPYASPALLPDFPLADRLGRVAVGKVEIKVRPDPDSQTVGVLYEDGVLPWIRETVGVRPALIFSNQRWVETPEGYIYGPYFQPVYNRPNQPVKQLPQSSLGTGMWAEVTVPYAEAVLDRAASTNSWVEARLEQGQPLRVYYSQVFWIDQIKTDAQGRSYYRVNPNYYGGVDMLWAAAEAFRPISAEELSTINPESSQKWIQVDARDQRQVLSCYEGKSEVYFCRVSTGAKYDMFGNIVDKWVTPVGTHRITRKYLSLQMSGGTTGAGYDLPGIGWTSIFATGGVAIHSTHWHNNFGDPVSHGCVNCSPEDARWIWRWTQPGVQCDPGMLDVTLTGEDSTRVEVIEG